MLIFANRRVAGKHDVQPGSIANDTKRIIVVQIKCKPISLSIRQSLASKQQTSNLRKMTNTTNITISRKNVLRYCLTHLYNTRLL
jgi:hypothetical protein